MGALGGLIPLAVFLSAGLVFLVQPLIGRLLLPSLGGAPAVWNISLVFFQAMLLAGYAYAHRLQRLGPARVQAAVHLAVLAVAAMALPLGVTGAFGPPDVERPVAWLLLVLLASAGAPFAALSATAPLLQAWWAAAWGGRRDPYPLYAASNAGSLLALLAYPLLVEPALGLAAQTRAWTVGYGLFAALTLLIALRLPPGGRPSTAAADRGAPGRWRARVVWTLLAAIPSSLLLGVTAHISTDVASAPFLWVVPLALYLLTFVLAFSPRAAAARPVVLPLQALAAVAATAALPFTGDWAVLLPAHLAAFFLTAWLCHGRLAEARPPPERLTEFYLALALGGVLGGAFNALAAPVLFPGVWEYPLALILAVVARPWGPRRLDALAWGSLAWGLAAAALVFVLAGRGPPPLELRLAIGSVASAAFLLRERALLFALMLAVLALSSARAATHNNYIRTERSFFGVHRVAFNSVPGLGAVRFLMHGTTMHGAQSAEPGQACRPLTYYTPQSPIGQAVRAVQAAGPAEIAVVGLGAGAVAALSRPEDRLRFFEIDPVVADLARDAFIVLDECTAAPTVILGDARLTLGREPAGRYDLLLVDAFSSDAVPSHLLTAEAVSVWRRALAPGGVLVLHVSNRNLELEGPAAAALRANGLEPLAQLRPAPAGAPPLADMTSHVLAASADPAAVARLRRLGPWRPARRDVPPWTDDRTDVLGALLREKAH